MTAHILIVEDDAHLRRMLRRMLERAGHDVTEAGDGNAGLKAFRQLPVDLIITDIIMPGKEGIEMIHQLRSGPSDVKIIAMSGGGRVSADEYLHVAKLLGADHTLQKPFRMRDLLRAVDDQLSARAA